MNSSAEARPASPASPPVEAQRSWWIAALLVVAVFLTYQPAWRADFIWDDDAHLTKHVCIVGPLGFKEIWTTSEANYFPLVLTTFWVVNKLVGLNPLVFHLLGIALHAACAVALWRVLAQLRVPAPWLGAALWALHPVQVESVAWVSEIINTQSGLFFLLSLLCATRWFVPASGVARRRDYALALVFGAAAILSKPSTVMLPIALALCCWWRRGSLRWSDARWLTPFFVLALAASAWAIWEQRVRHGAQGGDWALTLPERVVIAGRVLWFYLGKLLWPLDLSFIYPRWTVTTSAAAFVPAVFAAGLGVLLWWRRATLKPATFALGYFAAMLFPVLGFFNVYYFRYSFVADHFQYLAGMGPMALVGAVGATAAARFRLGAFAVPLALTVVLAAAIASWRHAHHFRNDEALWRATLRTNPTSILANSNLGVILLNEGKLEDALTHFRTSLATHPNLPETHYNIGTALMRLGRDAEALAHFETALRLRPDASEAHVQLATLLARDPARRTDAIHHYERALAIVPGNADALSNLSVLLTSVPGRAADAVAHATAALRLRPNSADAHFNLAAALERLPGRLSDAVAEYEAALRLAPTHLKATINLGLALTKLPSRTEDARRHYEAALAAHPESAVLHNNFAILLANAGDRVRARTHFERAVQLDPNYTAARDNLARLGPAAPPPR